MSNDSSAPDRHLFRKEALDAHSSRHGAPLGEITQASWMITLFLALLMLVVAVFFVTTKFARKETVTGLVQPTAGAVKVIAYRPGIVTKVFVHEGQEVERGNRIALVSVDTYVESGPSVATLMTRAADDQLTAIEDQAQGQKRQVAERLVDLAARETGSSAQISSLTERIDQQRQIIRRREETVRGYTELYDKGIVGVMLLRQQEEGLIAARQALTGLAEQLDQAAAVKTQLAAERHRLEAEDRIGQAQLAGQRSQIREKQAGVAGQNEIAVVAEAAGRVSALQLTQGSSLTPGTTLGVILPAGAALEAQLWVPSRAIGFMRSGDRVRLMYDAFPFQKFGVGLGSITEIARSPTPPQELPFQTQNPEALYRVNVKLDQQSIGAFGGNWPLAPGMRLTADVVLERRSILAWLLEPVLAARERSRP